jgi:serine/threonine-protein kinase
VDRKAFGGRRVASISEHQFVIPIGELRERLEHSLGEVFAIERELGGGGMSRVFLARERALDRQVVIKVLHPELAGVNVDRFRREIQLVAQLQHPHIVPVHMAGEASGILYFTMPYIDGESLRAWLLRESRLPVDDVLRILHDVADALAYAHERGIVHRDIKPDNVLVSRRHAMVTDFGVAKALTAAAHGGVDEAADRTASGLTTGGGLAIGTPAYMAPEQAAGDPSTDHRADIYAFGVLAYELLTGRAPFTARPPSEILAAHIAEAPQPVNLLRDDLPPLLTALVMQCLAKRPTDRPQTAAAVRSAIEAVATPGGGTAIEGTVSRRRSARRAVAVTVGTALVLIASAVAYSRRPPPAPPADENLVAVAPFRVASADASLRYLREGMLDLLSAKLTGATGPRSADPRSLLTAWRRAADGADSVDLPRARALEVAEGLGAGQLLIGDVTGDSSRITLHAVLVRVRDGRAQTPVQVEGDPDSLPKLVDMLTAKLLATDAGENDRLAALTSTSLPALRSFLNGQWMYRRGRYRDAAREYQAALELDSTFALAAVRLATASNWFGVPAMREMGLRLAWAGRDRLSPRDRALLDATAGPNYPASSSYREILEAKQRYVALAPDRADAWFELGDALFHFGAVVGYPDSDARAADALKRALALDSTYAPAAEHLLLIEAHAGDTGSVRRLGTHFLAIHPASENADGIRWRMAVALGDSAALAEITRRTQSLTPISAHTMAHMSQMDAVDLDRAQRVADAAVDNARAPTDRAVALMNAHDLALNRGRPSAAMRANTRAQEAAANARVFLRERVRDALYWDGDSTAAAAAVRELERTAFGPTPEKPGERFGQIVDLCNVELWRAGHDDTRTVASSVDRLRGLAKTLQQPGIVSFANSCAILLDAVAATSSVRSDAATAVAALDSMLRTGPGGFVQDAGNLILARLKEQGGDVRGALAAVRRRETFLTRPLYLSTFLREEGRLAALAGESDAAIEAYRHYLTLRAAPEPPLKSEVEYVRDELGKLERANGGAR